MRDILELCLEFSINQLLDASDFIKRWVPTRANGKSTPFVVACIEIITSYDNIRALLSEYAYYYPYC